VLPPRLRAHFDRPRHAGDLPGASHVGRAENPACGDLLWIQLRVEGGRIERAAFRAQGCSAVIAIASLVAESLEGRSLGEAEDLDVLSLVAEAGGAPPGKEHAPAVVRRALLEALGRAG
jgi:NifU-like protein involved in Fe-S cluster formation